MKRSILAMLATAASLLAATSGMAQDDLRERARMAIELADHRIEQADMLVTDSGHELALQELARAVEFQTRAKQEFALDHFRIAIDLALRAKERAERAIALVRGLPDPDRLRAQLERTMELLQRARDQIEECDDERARAMLNIAAEMQKRAVAAAEEGRYLAALQLTTSARERALKALRLCRLEENVRESAERALRRTEEVILRAQEQVARAEENARASEQAQQALDRAVGLQERAQGEFRSERYPACLRLTQSARAFAYRAIRLVSGNP